MKILKWLSIFGILSGQIWATFVHLNIWLQIVIATGCLANICFWGLYEAYQKVRSGREKRGDLNEIEFFPRVR